MNCRHEWVPYWTYKKCLYCGKKVPHKKEKKQ